ncbi:MULTISPECIES: hypothetical protein [Burkholderia]|uniref:hypothetical protein n=1 Tax=Burkholderia TaxID=32008 RepID=UPI001F0DC3A0|nr:MULTISPECIES: hypothetical protein [Burkholderia]
MHVNVSMAQEGVIRTPVVGFFSFEACGMNMTFRLPVALQRHENERFDVDAQDDETFAAKQVEFIRALYGHALYLRTCGREVAVGDAFLAGIVNVLEALELNSPDEAQQCLSRLKQIIDVVFSRRPTDGMEVSEA